MTRVFGATACKPDLIKLTDSTRKELGVGILRQIHDFPKRLILVDYETEYMTYNIDRFNERCEPADLEDLESVKQLKKLKNENNKLKESKKIYGKRS